MTTAVDHITSSFEAIGDRIDELTMTFYMDLFAKHPEAKPLFQHVDLVRQRRKLAAMLTLIVTNLNRMVRNGFYGISNKTPKAISTPAMNKVFCMQEPIRA